MTAGSILATPAQREVETLALWLVEQPGARAQREIARSVMLTDPVAQTVEGRVLLDRVLDEWIMFLAMRVANSDVTRPKVIWGADNTARRWLGHVFPGALAAIENPDNTNREMRLDGQYRYEIRGSFGRDPASFSLTMERMEGYHLGIGTHVDALAGGTIVADAGGNFVVTIDSSAADGRANHLQTVPGPLMLYSRDSQLDWDQDLARYSITLLDQVDLPQRDQASLLDEFIAAIQPWVTFWNGFKDGFLDHPEPNVIVGPRGREGGWGFLAGGRFQIDEDEALIITARDGGAAYTGFQIADPWTMSPDPAHRTVSRNKVQSRPGPDGSCTYILAASEPGFYNWLDTSGLGTGWFLLRWQAVPAEARPAEFLGTIRLVKLTELESALPAGTPRVTLEDRRAETAKRSRCRKRRLQ